MGASETQNFTGHMILLVRQKFVAAMSWCVFSGFCVLWCGFVALSS